MAKPKIHNRYENMEFPKYVFQEYPKMIGPKGNRVMVTSPEEEQATLARLEEDGRPAKISLKKNKDQPADQLTDQPTS